MPSHRTSRREQYTQSYHRVVATRSATARQHGRTWAISPEELNEIRGHSPSGKRRQSRDIPERTKPRRSPSVHTQPQVTSRATSGHAGPSAPPTSQADNSMKAGAVKWGFYSDVYLLEAFSQQQALDLGPPSNSEDPSSWDRPTRAMHLALFCHSIEGFSNNGVRSTDVTVPRQEAAFTRAKSLHDDEGSEIEDRDEWTQTVVGISWRGAGVMGCQWPLVRQVIEASIDKGDTGMLQYIRGLDPRRDMSEINGLAEEHLGSLVRAHSYFNPCPM